MGVKFLTPVQLWQDFDVTETPLDISVVYSGEFGGRAAKGVYFTAVNDEVGQVRAFADISVPQEATRKAIIRVITSETQAAGASLCQDLAKRGFIVMTLNLSGKEDETGNAVHYSDGYAYASSAVCNVDILNATPSAKSSPLFLWARTVRRAITLLQYLYPNTEPIVVGTRTAALVAWEVAASDTRVKALVSLLGRYVQPAADGDDTSNADSYMMALSAKASARLVHCPCLMIAAAGMRGGDVVKLTDVISQVPENVPVSLCVTPKLTNQIDRITLNALYKWLDYAAQSNADLPMPELSAEDAENGLKFTLKADGQAAAVAAKLYCAFTGADAEYRNWHEYEMQKVGDVWQAEVPLVSANKVVLSYASATYRDGLVLSSRAHTAVGASVLEMQRTQFLCDTDMESGFFADTSDLGTVCEEGAMSVRSYDDGVEGFSAKGTLITNILSETYRYAPATSLHISVRAEVTSIVRITLVKADDGKISRYTAQRLVEGEEWEQLILQPDDFKTDSLIPMKDWDNLLRLELPDTEGIIYNNFLWL